MIEEQVLSELSQELTGLRRIIADTDQTNQLAKVARLLSDFQDGYYDFREICDNLYDGIHITDGEGRVIFINKAYTRTTGIRPEQILGRRVADIEAEGVLYRGSVTAQVLKRREQVNSVALIKGLDKEVLVTGTPVFDRQGNIRLVVTNTRDFPELKRMEQQLLSMAQESERANEELSYLRSLQAGGHRMVYRSKAMRSVMELVQSVSGADVTVLITGESGTGKELIAEEIYQHSSRKGKPFIKVNCAAIPSELLESELFGYAPGAFTGARSSGKAGLFELADTGVILLDEIGDLPLTLQPKLLRVLQERELLRIGGTKPTKLNIRVIASTNKDLLEEVRRGTFREDLYYRLNVVPVMMRPLRERREDIPALAGEFCRRFGEKYGKAAVITGDAMQVLTDYDWPGNIRELENLLERLVVTNMSGAITRRDVSLALYPTVEAVTPETDTLNLRARVGAYEKEIILETLAREGSLRKAAKVLGVDHSTLAKKCQSYEKAVHSQKGLPAR
ncbi:MAG: sigma 54-interacting transcriptional regulator [Clostridiales bacterium]|nr:sigma 54-interacting transcriptional regulator [Clostridiales bacterium]